MNSVEPPYGEDPRFRIERQRVQSLYFSRDPELWPFLADPACRAIIDFRRQHLLPEDALASYPRGETLRRSICEGHQLPQRSRHPSDGPDPLLPFAAALSKNFEDPACVENVITMACDPAIFGTMLATLANPNLAYYDYAELAADLERSVIRQIASLAGYDPHRATGIFTQGGTMCNLYGYLLGIRKTMPDARLHGIGARRDYRFLNSQAGHYSNTTNLSLLGTNVRDNAIRIRMTADNALDIVDLEEQLTACFRLRCSVPTIMLTMGTTDTFAVDDIAAVWQVRERLCERFGVYPKPHIHVDSTVGWPMMFFLGYDFESNPLHINAPTLDGLRRQAERFSSLRLADSFAVDFHKWGYVPYMSSIVMIRDGADLDALANDPENFSYFEPGIRAHTHLQSTIECSRGAAGVFGAHAALQYLGVEGYRVTLAHCLQNANYLRHRLGELPNVKLIAAENQGPSVCFRVYDPKRVADAEAEFAFESQFRADAHYLKRVTENSRYHRRTFLARRREGLWSNWIQSAAHSTYAADGRYTALPGEKAVFLNPLTDRARIDAFVETLVAQGCAHDSTPYVLAV